MDTVRACIERHAADTPERTFLIAPDVDKTLSFAELKTAVDDVGRQLDRLGVAQGAKVAFLLNNGYWTLRLFLGVMASNRIIVPLNAVAGTLQLVHVLGHSDTEIVFVEPQAALVGFAALRIVDCAALPTAGFFVETKPGQKIEADDGPAAQFRLRVLFIKLPCHVVGNNTSGITVTLPVDFQLSVLFGQPVASQQGVRRGPRSSSRCTSPERPSADSAP